LAINKNFVVKHGLEVNEDLILANADTGSVGIATTNPRYLFHVNGGIGVTNAYISGIATVKNNLVLNGVLTVNASAGSTGQYLRSTATGVEWASFPTLRTSSSYIATTSQTTFTFAYTVGLLDVYVNGVKLANTEYTASDGVSVVLSTPCFGGETVEIIGYGVSSVGAGTSGIAGLTIQEEGSITGNIGGVTSINFVGAAVTAVGTGAGVTVYITENNPQTYWVSTAAGIHTLSNVGIGTTNPVYTLDVDGYVKVRDGLIVNGGSTYPAEFSSDVFVYNQNVEVTGSGNLTVSETTSSGQLNVSGISTLSNVVVGGATTELLVNGDARITGILTIGTASITIDPSTNTITTNNIIVTKGSSQPYYAEPHSVNDGLPIQIIVGVSSTKQTTHRFFGTGGIFSYLLDAQESPYLNFIPGKTYQFIQEDASNTSRPIKFYTDIDYTAEYTTGVSTPGGISAGSTGFYTQLVVTESTPSILYYDNETIFPNIDGYMGNQINVIGSSVAVDGRWTLTGDGSNYTFTGIGITSGNNTDPVLYLARGRVYEFVNNAGGSHPFEIRESSGGSAYTTGVTGSSSGTTRFEVPMNAPNTLFYQCTVHAGMGNTISVYPSLI